jgi:DNA-binding CsgD family transcriptional regulator
MIAASGDRRAARSSASPAVAAATTSKLLAAVLTASQTAERLGIARDTVRTHVRNATVKLEAKARVQAVALALEQGEIALEVDPGR